MKSPLISLTSAKAFNFFIIFFAIGCASIYTNQYVLIIPPALVVLYGLILITAQNKYRVSISSETKNSPYFLGFLFTLGCLLNMFLTMGLSSNSSQNFFIDLIPQIGTALSTTIVGLIMRHIIISYDPAVEEGEKLWRMATEELKENSNTYRVAQEKLIDLINEFSKTRKELIEQEQEASKEHVALLSESIATFSELGKNSLPKVREILVNFDEIRKKLDEFINTKLQRTLEEQFSRTSEELEKVHNNFIKSISEVFANMEKSTDHLEEKIDSFKESFNSAFDNFPDIQKRLFEQTGEKLLGFQNNYLGLLSETFQQINKDSHTLKENLSAISTNFDECKSIIDNGYKDNLLEIRKKFSGLSDSVGNANATINTCCTQIQNHISAFDELSGTHLNTFKKEIDDVDRIIGSFIEVTKRRLV
jgi:hypothetical protein